ncbi:MAG: hypothetical protein D6732_27950 [Methanobacteriota archaeon]|nr:MAG: hypothetical protein D6732_27950 [Euryarchaeota archaeon]
MPSDYVSILRNRELLKTWIDLVNTSKEPIPEEKIESLEGNKDIFVTSKALIPKDGKYFPPRLELIFQGFIEELLHLTLNDLEQDKLLHKIAKTIRAFQVLLDKVGRDYENTYRSQFGKYRILMDKIRELTKEKIRDQTIDIQSSQNLIDKFEGTRQTINHDVLEILQKTKATTEIGSREIDTLLEQLTIEIDPILKGTSNFGEKGHLEVIQEVLDYITKQHNQFKEKFHSFKARTSTGIELIKIEINKLNRSQTEFVNSLDDLLSRLVFNSLEQIAQQTEQIVDHIFIDMRKTLDEIRKELQKISEITEQESVEGIENLVSSVFDMNVEILKNQAEALEALKESSASIKDNQVANLNSMEENLSNAVKQTTADLRDNIERLKLAKEVTKESISDIIQMMLQVERNLLDTFRSNVELIGDLSVNSIQESILVANEIENEFSDKLTNLELALLRNEGNQDVLDGIFSLAINTLNKFTEEIQDQFKLSPKNEEYHSEEQIKDRIKAMKENLIMNFTQEAVDLGKQGASLREKEITETTEKLKEEMANRLASYKQNGKTALNRIVEFKTQFERLAIDTYENLDEAKVAFEKETMEEIDAGFEQILSSLNSLHGGLDIFWSNKIPNVFQTTKQRTENIERLFIEVLDKATALANKNIKKLEENRENVGLILTGQFSALKETLISSLNEQFSSLNNRILQLIEGHRQSIKRKIDESSGEVFEHLSKELDKPLKNFIALREQIISSVDRLEELRLKEIEALTFDVISSIGKIAADFQKTLDAEHQKALSLEGNNRREAALVLERLKRKVKPLISDIYVQIEVELYTLLSTAETDLEALKELALNMLDVLNKTGMVIDNAFVKLLTELNLFQKNLQPSTMIQAIVKGSIKLMDKLKEHEKEAGLSVVDVVLLELLGNLVERTGKPPEIDLKRFEEKVNLDFELNQEKYQIDPETIRKEFGLEEDQ